MQITKSLSSSKTWTLCCCKHKMRNKNESHCKLDECESLMKVHGPFMRRLFKKVDSWNGRREASNYVFFFSRTYKGLSWVNVYFFCYDTPLLFSCKSRTYILAMRHIYEEEQKIKAGLISPSVWGFLRQRSISYLKSVHFAEPLNISYFR